MPEFNAMVLELYSRGQIEPLSFGIVFSDVNQCLDDNGGCGQICINQVPGYECNCNTGYVLQDDRLSCSGTYITYMYFM